MIAKAGKALIVAGVLITHHHHPCHWHLKVTGGQTPNSTIVLHLTNTCVNNGGPQIIKQIGKVENGTVQR